jgi:hypothetical protein
MFQDTKLYFTSVTEFLDIIRGPDSILRPTTFWRLDSVSVLWWNLLSWAQSKELVPMDRIQSPKRYVF